MSATVFAERLPMFGLPVVIVLFLTFGIGPNAALALLACFALISGILLLWRPGEPPILLFIFLYQWLQSSIGIFYSNWKGVPLEDMMVHHGEHGQAAALCLIGLLFLGIGLRVGAGCQDPKFPRAASSAVLSIPYVTFVKLYVATWIFSAASDVLSHSFPGLSQLLLALASFKWAAFVVLTYATFVRPGGGLFIWFTIFAAEFIFALGGYFSSFRDVFIYTLIGLGAAQVRVSIGRALFGSVLFGLLVFIALLWTAVKSDYRQFARGDNAAQVVTVDFATGLAKLWQLTAALESTDIKFSAENLIKRISYTEYFGATLLYVPDVVPHEKGTLWTDAMTRPLMPRFLFPEKPIIDESLLTATYTGLEISGMDQGTQISIGYMGEAYIDFGRWGMFFPIFLLGLLMGRIYRWILLGRGSFGIVGLGLAPVVLMVAILLETSSAKIIGGLFAWTLAVWLVVSFVLPRCLPWAVHRQPGV